MCGLSSFMTVVFLNFLGLREAFNYSWVAIDGIPNGNFPSVAMSSTGSTLVAVSGKKSKSGNGGIWTSFDNGTTFSLANAPLVSWSLVAASSNCKHIIAARKSNDEIQNDFSNVYLSHDFGASWVPSVQLNFSGTWVALSVSSSGQHVAASLYTVSSNTSGLHISNDYGSNWSYVLRGKFIYDVATDTLGQYIIASALFEGIFMSSDYGRTWDVVHALQAANVTFSYSVACDASCGNMFVAGEAGSLWVSHNFGLSWARNSKFPYAYQIFAIAVSNDSQYQVVSCRDFGIVNSRDGGLTWNVVEKTGITTVVMSSGGSRVAVASEDNSNFGVQISNNYGQNYSHTALYGKYWQQIAASASGQYVAAITSTQLWLSFDYGETWFYSPDTPQAWQSIAMSASGEILVAANNWMISRDYGLTWNVSTRNFGLGVSIACSADCDKVAVSSSTGIYLSSDYGTTWETVTIVGGPTSWEVITCDATMTHIYVTGQKPSTFVYMSSDGGTTWSVSLNVDNPYWTAIRTNSNGQYVVVNSYHHGIYYSKDYGQSWNTSTARSGIQRWNFAGDSTGQYLLADIDFIVSQDYGATWVDASTMFSPLTIRFQGVACAATCEIAFVGIDETTILVSNLINGPTVAPTWQPTVAPSMAPSQSSVSPTVVISPIPTLEPSHIPSEEPTFPSAATQTEPPSYLPNSTTSASSLTTVPALQLVANHPTVSIAFVIASGLAVGAFGAVLALYTGRVQNEAEDADNPMTTANVCKSQGLLSLLHTVMEFAIVGCSWVAQLFFVLFVFCSHISSDRSSSVPVYGFDENGYGGFGLLWLVIRVVGVLGNIRVLIQVRRQMREGHSDWDREGWSRYPLLYSLIGVMAIFHCSLLRFWPWMTTHAANTSKYRFGGFPSHVLAHNAWLWDVLILSFLFTMEAVFVRLDVTSSAASKMGSMATICGLVLVCSGLQIVWYSASYLRFLVFDSAHYDREEGKGRWSTDEDDAHATIIWMGQGRLQESSTVTAANQQAMNEVELPEQHRQQASLPTYSLFHKI